MHRLKTTYCPNCSTLLLSIKGWYSYYGECPNCRLKLEFFAEYGKVVIQCPYCKQDIQFDFKEFREDFNKHKKKHLEFFLKMVD